MARIDLPDGVVVGGELRDIEGLASALKELFAKHKLPKRGVRLGIANNRIGVRTFEITGIDDPRQLANAIRFRAQETLPIPLEEAVLDWQVLSEHVDPESGQAVRRVLLVVAYRELVDRYVLACRQAGIKLAGIDLEAFAMLRALSAPPAADAPEPTGAQVVVNVGHDRSTFAVSDGRHCEFTRVLGWGGQSLSVAIARALDMTPSEATPIKHALSLVATYAPPDGVSVESMNTARDAVNRELQSFARELVSSLRFYQNQPGSLGIGELVLTGGTAHLPGFADELNRMIGVRVRVGDPLNRVVIPKKFREPDEYSLGSLDGCNRPRDRRLMRSVNLLPERRCVAGPSAAAAARARGVHRRRRAHGGARCDVPVGERQRCQATARAAGRTGYVQRTAGSRCAVFGRDGAARASHDARYRARVCSRAARRVGSAAARGLAGRTERRLAAQPERAVARSRRRGRRRRHAGHRHADVHRRRLHLLPGFGRSLPRAARRRPDLSDMTLGKSQSGGDTGTVSTGQCPKGMVTFTLQGAVRPAGATS